MKVDAKHPLYDAFLPRWQVCSDAVAGPHVMSQKADKYLCSLAEGNDSEQAIILKQKQIERDHKRQLDALVERIEALDAK